MIRLDMEQGSPEWIDVRLGIPTASAFSRLITPGKQVKSAESAHDRYMNELLAEWLIGEPIDEAVSGFMQRGREEEQNAVAFYEALRDVDTETVGFCLTDDGRAGCSPDRLVCSTGGVEIKILSAAKHVGALRDTDRSDYYAQVQGCLWITEREWWDLICYHPTIQSTVIRFERDDIFIGKLEKIVNDFCNQLELERKNFISRGYIPAIERKVAVL